MESEMKWSPQFERFGPKSFEFYRLSQHPCSFLECIFVALIHGTYCLLVFVIYLRYLQMLVDETNRTLIDRCRDSAAPRYKQSRSFVRCLCPVIIWIEL